MNDRHERLSELFLEALELAPTDRAAFLDRECGNDAPLRRRLESMLAHEEGSTALATGGAANLESGAIADEAMAALAHSPPASLPVGRRVGAYEIVDVLGRGGWAVVYRARQKNPDREVALKLLAPGLTSPAAREWFEHEVRILGRLQHPGIARIFEAGTAEHEAGPQPFFAMELVEGRTITEHCRETSVGRASRLRLLCEISDAIHDAHQKGVIHRDLKPGNILVDAQGRPRILDFGVARATDGDLAKVTLQNQAGQILGTLSYMSPEQTLGDPLAVDTRSDVYSLGVILFELLSDSLPHDTHGVSMPRALEIVRNEAPRLLGSAAPGTPHDLVTITHKCLEKEPDRRYESAAALSEDIRRFLHHEPIAARPPSTWYQLERFARRNKVLVGGVAAVMLALALGLTTTLKALAQSRENEVEATLNLEDSEEFADLFTDLFAAVDPYEGAGPEVTVKEVLDSAAPALLERKGGNVRATARMLDIIGRTYSNLEELALARQYLEAALSLYESDPRSRPGLIGYCKSNLAHLIQKTGSVEEAAALARESIDQSESRLQELLRRSNYAQLRLDSGHAEEAYSILTEVEPGLAELIGPDDPRTLLTRALKAEALRLTDRAPEAETELRDLIRLQSSVLYPTDARALSARAKLVLALIDQFPDRAKLLEAEQEAEALLALRTEAWGPDHPDALKDRRYLGLIAARLGDAERGVQVLEEVLDQQLDRLGSDHEDTLATELYLAEALVELDPARGEMLIRNRLAVTAESSHDSLHYAILSRNLLAQAKSKETIEAYADNARLLRSRGTRADTIRLLETISENPLLNASNQSLQAGNFDELEETWANAAEFVSPPVLDHWKDRWLTRSLQRERDAMKEATVRSAPAEMYELASRIDCLHRLAGDRYQRIELWTGIMNQCEQQPPPDPWTARLRMRYAEALLSEDELTAEELLLESLDEFLAGEYHAGAVRAADSLISLYSTLEMIEEADEVRQRVEGLRSIEREPAAQR